MLPVDRQSEIIHYVNDKRKTTIAELAEKLSVSQATVRRDVDRLSKAHKLRKAYGGILSMDYSSFGEIPTMEKVTVCREEKEKIGRAAAQFVKNGDLILLDSGTTTLEVARNLSQKNLTIITNDIEIALTAKQNATSTIYLVGGLVEKSVNATVGMNAYKFISSLRVTRTFLSADAVDTKRGITDRTFEDGEIKRAMAEAADETILVADHTKLGKSVFSEVGLLDKIQYLITDSIDADMNEEFEMTGIRVIIA